MDSELDFTGASIEERIADDSDGHGPNARRYQPAPAPSIQLPNQDAEYVNHIAIDIGGSLIKLVYFSPDPVDNGSSSEGDTPSGSPPSSSPGISGSGDHLTRAAGAVAVPQRSSPQQQSSSRGGKLHFVKFETNRVQDVISFIEAKGLHRYCGRNGTQEMRVKATGGGAYKYADVFKERLGVVLEKEDEMACLVSGCNFLLRAIHHEALMYESGTTTFVPTNEDSDLYPYLLVNIGSGVSMVKVSGNQQFERVSGSSIGGGTYWGLCRLLTQRTNFDEMLELSVQGDNSSVDMLVGDIYGGRDYSSIGLSATTIASSFGKVVTQDKALEDYNPADMCLALCRMVAYNIGQLAHMNAVRHGIKRIFFGGFFIRGHPYTMETISYAIRFWSKGEMAAMFLRHEGYLGAVGAFLTVHPMVGSGLGLGGGAGAGNAGGACAEALARKVRARFVERFSTGAPLTGGAVVGPAIRGVSEKVSWVEKFIAAAASTSSPSPALSSPEATSSSTSTLPVVHSVAATVVTANVDPTNGGDGGGGGSPPSSLSDQVHPSTASQTTCSSALASAAAGGGGGGGVCHGTAGRPRMSLHVGVLHYSPTLESFPLLANTASYEPNTLDINSDDEELRWWIQILRDQIPILVEKAIASEGAGELQQRRAAAFGRAFGAHLDRLQNEPGCYGALGLSELFGMREECLREFGFGDVYRLDKQRENAAALAVLPDLLRELDSEPLPARLLSLMEGVLAANIFDWGSKACVALYQDGTILDIYRTARLRLSKRPWAVDNFDAFAARFMLSVEGGGGRETPGGGEVIGGSWEHPPYRRVMMFVDNSGADILLGMLPFARELLRLGCEVVLVANSLPAINDITSSELRSLLCTAAEVCPIIKAAREAAVKVESATGGHVPPYPGMNPVRRSNSNLQMLLLQQQQLQQLQRRQQQIQRQSSSQQQQQQQQQGAGDVDATAASSRVASTTALEQLPIYTASCHEGEPAVELVSLTTSITPAATQGSELGVPVTSVPQYPPPPSPSSSSFPHPEPRPSSASRTSPAAAASAVEGGGGGASDAANLRGGADIKSDSSGGGSGSEDLSSSQPPPPWHSVATDPRVNWICPKLYVVSNGQGSPCLDLRRVPDRLAEACVGVDLLVIEGMGRAIHTNFTAKFTCDVLKLAMIKTERLARRLFNGTLYDCVCIFDQAEG